MRRIMGGEEYEFVAVLLGGDLFAHSRGRIATMVWSWAFASQPLMLLAFVACYATNSIMLHGVRFQDHCNQRMFNSKHILGVEPWAAKLQVYMQSLLPRSQVPLAYMSCGLQPFFNT